MFRDGVLGVLLVALAALALYGVRDLDMFGRNHVPGPAFLPTVLAIGMVVLAAFIGIPNRARGEVTLVELRGAAAYFVLLVAASVVFVSLGALVTVAVYVAAELMLIHRRTWVTAATYGLGTAFAVWLVFYVALDVRLPQGLLSGVLS